MGERIRRTESHRARVGEPSLFLRSWLPKHPRRLVVLVHGMGEHSGRYDEVAAWLAERGCAVYGYDHRGHGRSPGEPVHVGRFSELLDDLDWVASELHRAHPELPASLLGHSMGGLVAAVFLAERRGPFTRAVLSAPLLGVPDESRGQVLRARIVRWFRPRHRIATPIDPEALSTDPAVGEAYLADPLVRHESMSVSFALALWEAMSQALPGAVGVPTLVLHGSEDTLCASDTIERFARGLPRGEFIRYPGLRHALLNEPSRGEIYHEILRFLEKPEETST